MHRADGTRPGTSCAVARRFAALATLGALLLLAGCAPPPDRGVPVRINLDPGYETLSGVPVRIAVVEPPGIGSGEEAMVTLTLAMPVGVLGQHIAVFYGGDRDLLTGIPATPSDPQDHFVPFGDKSVTFPIRAAETTDSGTVEICAKSYGTIGFSCLDVSVNGTP